MPNPSMRVPLFTVGLIFADGRPYMVLLKSDDQDTDAKAWAEEWLQLAKSNQSYVAVRDLREGGPVDAAVRGPTVDADGSYPVAPAPIGDPADDLTGEPESPTAIGRFGRRA